MLDFNCCFYIADVIITMEMDCKYRPTHACVWFIFNERGPW